MIAVHDNYLWSEVTEKIIQHAYYVYNELGFGFLEKVYEKALYKRLVDKGLEVKQQNPLNVYFENEIVGEYFADLIVDNKVIIEVKSVEKLAKIHEVQ